MEDSVKDLDSDINPTNPEPRFSIGGIFLSFEDHLSTYLQANCLTRFKQTDWLIDLRWLERNI